MEFYYVFQSYFIYLSILAAIYWSCKEALRKNKFTIIIVGLLFYSLLFGLRYGVGKDCLAYIEIYENTARGLTDERIEIGYTLLMQLFVWIGTPTWVFMGAVAMIQVTAVFLFFKKRLEVTPYLALAFVLGCVWHTYANGMRQSIAFAIFVYSLHFLENRKLVIHYLLIALAVLFHKSAMMLVAIYPAYLIISLKTPARTVQYLLLFSAVLLGRMDILNRLMDYISQGALMLGYEHYLEDHYADKMLRETESLGVGYYVYLTISFFVVYYSVLLTKRGKMLTFIYNLYLIGIILKYMFLWSSLIQRVNYYFLGFDFIIIAFLLYFLRSEGKRKGFIVLICLLAFMLVGKLYRLFDNSSAYYFIWKIDDYVRYST